jgi:thioredoxin-like negative regulator of GroEL
MLVFKNGQLVDRLLGAVPKDRIVNRLRTLL